MAIIESLVLIIMGFRLTVSKINTGNAKWPLVLITAPVTRLFFNYGSQSLDYNKEQYKQRFFKNPYSYPLLNSASYKLRVLIFSDSYINMENVKYRIYKWMNEGLSDDDGWQNFLP